MLILRNREASEAVNSKLRDIGLGEVDLDGDDKCNDQSRVDPIDHECAITENARVLCSKHEYKDIINEQLLSTLQSEVIECHTSDSDCSGAPLNKFQVTKLNQSKSAPPQV